MVQRYRNQVNEASAPSVSVRNFVDGAAAGAQVAGAFAGVGDEVRHFADVQKRRNDEYDATRVMEAQTEFNRAMIDFMDNPETGMTNSRRSGAARGVTDETDRYGDDLAAKIAEGLDNEEQRNVFLRIARQGKLPYWKQASEFEARETRAHQEQVFRGVLEQGVESVQRLPADDFAFKSAVRQGSAAIRSHYFGGDPEAVNAAAVEYAADLERRRIELVAQSDPQRAGEMILRVSYLPPEVRKEMESKIKTLELRESDRALIDDLVLRYGPNGKIVERIGREYPGEHGKELEARARSRIDDLKIREAQAEAELRQRQDEKFGAIRREAGRGRIPTQEELDALKEARDIDEGHFRAAEGWREVAVKRTDAERWLRIADPDWNAYTAQERQDRILQEMGRTPGERAEARRRIERALFGGDATDAVIDAEFGEGNIAEYEAEHFRRESAKYSPARRDFLRTQKGALAADLARMSPSQYAKRQAEAAAEKIFFDRLSRLDPQSPTYEKDVADIRTSALVAAVETWTQFAEPARPALPSPQAGGGNAGALRRKRKKTKARSRPPEPKKSVGSEKNASTNSEGDSRPQPDPSRVGPTIANAAKLQADAEQERQKSAGPRIGPTIENSRALERERAKQPEKGSLQDILFGEESGIE